MTVSILSRAVIIIFWEGFLHRITESASVSKSESGTSASVCDGGAGSTREELVYRLSGARRGRAATTRSAPAGRWASPAWPAAAAGTGPRAPSARATRPSASRARSSRAVTVCRARTRYWRNDATQLLAAAWSGRRSGKRTEHHPREQEHAPSAGWSLRSVPGSEHTHTAALQCGRGGVAGDSRPARSGVGSAGSCTAFRRCAGGDVSSGGDHGWTACDIHHIRMVFLQCVCAHGFARHVCIRMSVSRLCMWRVCRGVGLLLLGRNRRRVVRGARWWMFRQAWVCGGACGHGPYLQAAAAARAAMAAMLQAARPSTARLVDRPPVRPRGSPTTSPLTLVATLDASSIMVLPIHLRKRKYKMNHMLFNN